VSLDLVDKAVANQTIKDAWDLSAAMDTDQWCDYDTMALWTDSNSLGEPGGTEGGIIDDTVVATKNTSNTNAAAEVHNTGQGNKKGNVIISCSRI
jgi:hypothetical protein